MSPCSFRIRPQWSPCLLGQQLKSDFLAQMSSKRLQAAAYSELSVEILKELAGEDSVWPTGTSGILRFSWSVAKRIGT